jgi:hypothetical protein
MEMPVQVRDWLLEKDPLIRARLTGIPVAANDQRIVGISRELEEWPGPVMKRHNDAKLLYHKLVFLAELGVDPGYPGMVPLIGKILSKPSVDGPFPILGNIPTVFGGSGKDDLVWMLCDAPLVTYALARMGLHTEPVIQRSVEYMVSLQKEFGWPCSACSSRGTRFKGPGKRADPCPYANLIRLRLLSSIPGMENSKEARKGAEVLLDLWEYRKSVKYFLFGMGTDFSKLKAPLIWYDILHVCEVLTRFEFPKQDPRLHEMLELIRSKALPDGRFAAESVYRSWKDWDFGQKKEASGWITLMVYKIFDRM